ncbi:MAG: RHS repeat protein [Candidatus Gastranaerophilales bacterium]|nr:RHS repeat protein [Candidatus Gastranaerophilales bacterium]
MGFLGKINGLFVSKNDGNAPSKKSAESKTDETSENIDFNTKKSEPKSETCEKDAQDALREANKNAEAENEKSEFFNQIPDKIYNKKSEQKADNANDTRNIDNESYDVEINIEDMPEDEGKVEYYRNQETGFVDKEISYSADGEVETVAEFSYDKNGNVTNEVRYDAQGNKMYSNENSYDENGNLTYEVYRNSEGNPTDINEYVYDENNNKISLKNFDGLMNFQNITEFIYDENNNNIKTVTTYSDGSSDTYEFEDIDGKRVETRCIHEEINEDGTKTTTIEEGVENRFSRSHNRSH